MGTAGTAPVTGRPGRKPDPPTPGPGSVRDQSIHDIVEADALSCGYRTLAAVVSEQGKAWNTAHAGPLTVLSEDDPAVAAIVHLADAVVSLADAITRLHQAKREGSRRAEQHYEALLLVAGHMAREVPLGSFRRPTQPGRAA